MEFNLIDGIDCTDVKVDDSLLSVLANAGIAIAEQKSLLKSAKTPEEVQTALKLIGVTTGNLLHASTSMLRWVGKNIHKDTEIDIKMDGFMSEMSRTISNLFRKAVRGDSGKELIMTVSNRDCVYTLTKGDKYEVSKVVDGNFTLLYSGSFSGKDEEAIKYLDKYLKSVKE